MANEFLNSLLREYDQKKLRAELDLEERKNKLYDLIPRLRKIDDELNKSAINTAKNILNNASSSSELDDLNKKIKNLKEEKELILKKNNYDLSYLKPFYECNICNDTGFVTDKNYNTVMCNCLKQKLLNISFDNSNLSNLGKENFESFNESLFSDKVDSSKYKFNISPRKNILNIKNKSIEFVENFDDSNYKNLLFVGSTGLRKNIYDKLYSR